MFSKWACVFWEYAKDGGFKKMKIGGLFSKNGPQKGTFLSQPLDSEWAAEIRWEGEREKQSPELGGDAVAPPLPATGSSPEWSKQVLRCTVFKTKSTGVTRGRRRTR
jgi:hypothetical protein